MNPQSYNTEPGNPNTQPNNPAGDNPSTTGQYAQPVAPQPQRKRKRWTKLALIAGLAIILLGGGGAAAYFGYYLPNRPENVLKAALANSFSKDVTSAEFSGEMTAKTPDNMSFNASFSGGSDRDGRAKLTINLDAMLTTLTADFLSVDGKTMYVKAEGLDGIASLLEADNEQAAQYSQVLEQINGQWYEINSSLIESFGQTDIPDGALSEADMQKIGELYKQNSFIVIKEALEDEEINGTNSHHYKLGIDQTILQNFLNALRNTDLESFDTSKIPENLEANLKDADLSQYTIEVWIAKDSKRFTQFSLSAQQENVTFEALVTIESYNEPIEVEAPADALPLLDIITKMLKNQQAGSEGTSLPAQFL